MVRFLQVVILIEQFRNSGSLRQLTDFLNIYLLLKLEGKQGASCFEEIMRPITGYTLYIIHPKSKENYQSNERIEERKCFSSRILFCTSTNQCMGEVDLL